jgi:hypothetical protein
VSFHERTKVFRKVSAVAIDVSQILTRVPVDALASATGRCRRTVLNWQNKVTEPSASDLVSAMSEFDDVFNEVVRRLGKQTMTPDQIDRLRDVLNNL